MKRILILDDNLTVCLMLKSWLVKKNYELDTATNVQEAKEKVKEKPFDLILSDIRMPDADGFSFLSWVKKFDSDILVIMMTGFADIESVVEAMKSGAIDYIAKPIEPENLFKKIDDAFTVQSNQIKIKKIANTFSMPSIGKYKALLQPIDDLVMNHLHLLVIGETGTGKQSLAKYIFERKSDPFKPFIMLDCNEFVLNKKMSPDGLPENDINHIFQSAKGGILFLKNIHCLNLNEQDELLNNILAQKKDRHFTQCIVSTQNTLPELKKILLPKFCKIFDKIIELPKLKGDKETILFFSKNFIDFANIEMDKNIQQIDEEVLNRFYEYNWPGNIQELKNTILKAVLLTDGDTISTQILPLLFRKNIAMNNATPTNNGENDIQAFKKENYEKEKIKEALEIAKGNKTMASSLLNIDRKTLYNKIKLYHIEVN